MENVFACPECGKRLRLAVEFLGKKVRCSACRHAFRVPETGPDPEPPAPARGDGLRLQDDDPPPVADADDRPKEEPRRRKRKKRRRSMAYRPEAGRSGHWGFTIGTGILLTFWVTCAGLSFDSKTAAYGLVLVGVVTMFVGAGMVLWAAHQDGISVWTFSSGNAIVGVILLGIQLLVIPVLSVVHMVMDFTSAWKPAAILLLGIAMTASGTALTGVAPARPVDPDPVEESSALRMPGVPSRFWAEG